MSFFSTSFKRKLGFVSFAVLTSLVCSNQSFAMEPVDQCPIMKPRKTLTLDGVKILISEAKAGDLQAQDRLIEICSRGSYSDFLTPERIGFCAWKGQNSEDTIENRCYRDDSYAYFVLYQFSFATIAEQFPKLFQTIKERADQGFTGAQTNLGLIYAWGIGVDKDEREACKYFKLAADKGDAIAQTHLGSKYFLGHGVDKDKKESFRYCKLAADQGNAMAQFQLAIVLDNPYEGDMRETLKYLKLAADQGNAKGQSRLSNKYFQGDGVDQDMKKAFKYSKLAADQENADDQYILSRMYTLALGVDKDEKEAFRYCKRAVDQGHWKAPYELGLMYITGNGVDKNLIEGHHWLIKSKWPDVRDFIHYALPLTPNAPVVGDAFQKIISGFITENDPNMNKEGAVARLLMSHQFKIGMNKKCFSEGNFAIPELGKMYESIETSIADINNMMESLATIKPGFMVTAVSLCEAVKALLPNQITPFFSLDDIDGLSYLTLGEENVIKVNKFVKFLEKFEQMDRTLEKIAHLYSQGLDFTLQELKRKQPLPEDDCMNLAFIKDFTTAFKEQEEECNKFRSFLEKNEEQQTKFDLSLGKLMVRQHLTRIEILHEDGMAMTVKEHFKCLTCPNNSVEAFKEQEDKFEDLVLYLKLPLEEIEAERVLLRELHKQIKDLPSRGVGSRNKDLFEEYSILR